ncbi:prolyl oligopeptidase family serine peptidase [Amycolatopsis australiensis]|uniref:Dipeptidyl aminopeptidase/acylaminoacyl peptidase n=1 Tax=Amycolatopsis australiensis TaxID=546364 RepID=A0A1K1SE27_9PSEU|nr:prolyl oligopeptidase family serine peptidase [Amycolatopsis australiensis]SFW82633.1 Dipeptidyl aminopeptidase/acylaminoacyl peptidase [Amycolatopsis australiensis]
MSRISPYGTWSSPITAAEVAAAGGGPQWLDVVAGEVWWAEARPGEQGRVALVRAVPGGAEDVLPAPWNVRNRLHEYGGRPWAVADGVVVFTHWVDQRVYALRETGVAPLTPEPAQPQGVRYGDLRAGRAGEVWAVRERGVGPRPTDVERELVAIAVDGGGERVLAASHHFLTVPKLSPDGRHAAWFGWDHPAMPWDGTELCVAPVAEDGSFGPHRVVAGGRDVAVCQVEWETDSTLLALLDPDGWWNLHRVGIDGPVTNLAPVERELGGPLWKAGSRWFVPLGGGRHAVLVSGRLAVLDEAGGSVTPVAEELTAWSSTGLAVLGDAVVGIAGGPVREPAVVRVGPDGVVTDLTPQPELPSAYLPMPQERVFTTDAGETVPVVLYEPANPDFAAPEGELPPLLVHVHGGPTGQYLPVLDLEVAYFTSRGFAVAAVNYGGSTGFGRAYRERLREQWGVVDVADCVAVAEALAAAGLADGARLAIRGGSAGGFTAAASLTTTKTYRAGTVMYPVLDLAGWTGAEGDTHDFESRYLDGLIGPLPAAKQRYVERSPLANAASLAGPVLFQQGLEDRICPPEQADRFVAGLAGRGIPYAYQRFAGEQHGFRQAATIVAALEAELSFYGQVLGFETPGVAQLELSR